MYMSEFNILQELNAFFSTFNALPVLSILLKLIIITNIALLFLFIPRNTNKVKRALWLTSSGNSIEIIVTAKNTLTQIMPLSVVDVEWYLQEVRKKNPKALDGISKIYLCNRPAKYNANILGSYSPNDPAGKVIKIYTTAYSPLRNLFTIDFSEVGTIKIGFTHTQMKRMLLSTLGHEIGHNVMYKKTGRLFGDDVERFCDKFSQDLNIVFDPDSEAHYFHIDDPVDKFINVESLT